MVPPPLVDPAATLEPISSLLLELQLVLNATRLAGTGTGQRVCVHHKGAILWLEQAQPQHVHWALQTLQRVRPVVTALLVILRQLGFLPAHNVLQAGTRLAINKPIAPIVLLESIPPRRVPPVKQLALHVLLAHILLP